MHLSTENDKAATKRVVVLGAGFGGLTFAKTFSAPNTEVILVDKQNHHLFQPLLYQVATAGLSANEIAHPTRQVFAGRKNVRVILDEVVSIDLAQQQVGLSGQNTPLTYDYLVIGLGVESNFYGNPQWADYTTGLKSLKDALDIRQRVLMAYEKAENTVDPDTKKKLMTITIVGGGPTGVELAGAFAELGRLVLKNEFTNIDPSETRTVLIEAGPRLLPSFPEKLSKRAYQDLTKLGVEVKLASPVTHISDERVELENEALESKTIIWAAGMAGNHVVETLPVEKDRGNRIKVQTDCSIEAYPNVFAIGDIAFMQDGKGKAVPGVSPAAMQMGAYAAGIIRDEIRGRQNKTDRKPFIYRDKGSMATIGRSAAVAAVGRLKMTGFVAWLLWLAVHIFFLIGFRNRIAVLLQWIYAYINFKHGARIVFCSRESSAKDKPSKVKAA